MCLPATATWSQSTTSAVGRREQELIELLTAGVNFEEAARRLSMSIGSIGRQASARCAEPAPC
jgi:DNA-binding NarL/FixJ family response regulator